MSLSVLFDFDGTLGDTLSVGLEVVESFRAEYGFRPLTPELVREMREMEARAALDRVGLSLPRFFSLVRKVRKRMRQETWRTPVFPGIPELLEASCRRGWVCGVLTSNSKANVKDFLAHHGLSKWVRFVHSERSVFGKYKAVKRVMRLERLPPGRTVIVGDELRDLEAARRNGLPFLGVPWGYNAPGRLRREEMGVVVESAGEIYERLAELENEWRR